MIKQCGNFQNQEDFNIIIGLTMRQGRNQLWSNNYLQQVPHKKNQRIKPQHSDTVPNRPKQCFQFRVIDNEARQAYLRQRRAFLIFSRIQAQFGLKADTMLLAFEIFCKMDHQQFKATHLLCVCMFLAMKYEQIYPPSLKILVATMQWDISLQKYRQLQQMILIDLKANLHFQLLNRQLQQELGIVTPQIQHLGLYFIQIAIVTPAIYLNHSRLKIIQAITMILKNKGREHASAELIHICKQLIFSRVEVIMRYPFLYGKYSEECHFYVAQTALDSQLDIAIS